MKKSGTAVWLSYDLGVKGDYTGLYTWLDSKKAKECGNSIAFFTVQETDIKKIIVNLKTEIEANVKISMGNRIYIILRDGGRFIIGGRKASPWEGFGQDNSNNVDK